MEDNKPVSPISELSSYSNYIIIGIISLIALVFLPLLSSTAAIGFCFPTNAAGWILWIVTKLIVAVINVLIFHCFIMQGKDTAKPTPEYKLAQKILRVFNPAGKRILLSPEEWTSREYRKKGIFVVISSLLGAFSLTQAILSYDWVTMLTYLFVIIFGIIFGVLEQRKTFEVWSDGYLEYALWYVEERGTTLPANFVTDHLADPDLPITIAQPMEENNNDSK